MFYERLMQTGLSFISITHMNMLCDVILPSPKHDYLNEYHYSRFPKGYDKTNLLNLVNGDKDLLSDPQRLCFSHLYIV